MEDERGEIYIRRGHSEQITDVVPSSIVEEQITDVVASSIVEEPRPS